MGGSQRPVQNAEQAAGAAVHERCMLPVIDLCNHDGVCATCRLSLRLTPAAVPRYPFRMRPPKHCVRKPELPCSFLQFSHVLSQMFSLLTRDNQACHMHLLTVASADIGVPCKIDQQDLTHPGFRYSDNFQRW